MSEPLSLTRTEAGERAALIAVGRYDIAVDMTGLLDGPTLTSVSTITFSCREPGAATFVDCVAGVESATLNGVELHLSGIERGRIPLPDLEAHNVLVVRASTDDTANAAGILRTVDPSDKLVYVWTSFEPDAARNVWACFDQPDLKAPHAFTVTAPESWTVTSNGPPTSVEAGPVGAEVTARVWTFPDTPPLSTYVVVVNAGPFVELRSRRGEHDLGLFARQSCRSYLERDAEELFTLTDQGLRWYGEQFGLPFPQERYDQVFVPNMGGAMENWGCITFTDAALFRSAPSYAQRAGRASILLHEMAHMWFGDLVTMRWWDDLWLNEAFASWAATWALAEATEFTDAWAGFLVSLKLEGYRADMSPGTHPIRAVVPSVADAMANFDAITYAKGESVLKQLFAYVGPGAFLGGLRQYFREHAWGNTSLDDLIRAIGDVDGRDLTEWASAWLDRSGTDTIVLSGDTLTVRAPDDLPPRPHRLEIQGFTASADGLTSNGGLSLETSGTTTKVDLPAAELYLVNARDQTFAAVRGDTDSSRVLLERAGDLPDPISRALVGATAWDMLVKGELPPATVVATFNSALLTETSPIVVESFLRLSTAAAEVYAPPEQSAGLIADVADVALALTNKPEFTQVALRTLAGTGSTEAHFDALTVPAAHERDLGWRVLARRAELGDYDEAAVSAMERGDSDPEAWVRALGVRAVRPLVEAKQEAWHAMLVERSVPMGTPIMQLGALFWRPAQADLLRPFAMRYLDTVQELTAAGLLMVGSLIRSMFPTAVVDRDFLDRATRLARADGTHPAVRQALLVGIDTGERVLRARTV